MMSRVAVTVAIGVAFVAATSACGTLLDPAAAVVHGKKITIDEVQSAVEDFHESPEYKRLAGEGDGDAITREFEQSYLSQLIRRAVLTPEAAERGIEVTEQEITDQLESLKAEFPSEGAFEEALREQGLTLDQLEQLIHDRQLEEELRAEITKDIGPTDQEIEEHYEANAARFSETEVQHILVEERALANDIARQLQKAPPGRVDELFARLAKQHSTDPSNAGKAGDLGFFSPGEFVPEFEAGAAELEIGEISEPVQTEFGWHVIRVTDRRPLALDEVAEQIATELGGAEEEEAWTQWVREAYREADVKVNPRFGEFNLATQQVEDASARTVPGAELTPPVSGAPDPLQSP
ncbi:MAG TPA: peptidylprolyl isomerase [Actinomycetota bacterium]|nr:peptidylprolyl isomerase [Actinomycetota bacterium]